MFACLRQYAHHKLSTIIVAEDDKEMINTIQSTKDILALILPPQELNNMHFDSLPLENVIVVITSRTVSSRIFSFWLVSQGAAILQ